MHYHIKYSTLEQENNPEKNQEVKITTISDLIRKYPECYGDIGVLLLDLKSKEHIYKLRSDDYLSIRPIVINYESVWIEEFMILCSEEYPEFVISEYPFYCSQKYGKKIFDKILSQNTGMYPYAISILEQRQHQLIGNEIAFNEISEIYDSFINSITLFKLKELSKLNPKFIIDHIITFHNTVGFSELALLTVQQYPQYLDTYLLYKIETLSEEEMKNILDGINEVDFRNAVQDNTFKFQMIFDDYYLEIKNHQYSSIIIEEIISDRIDGKNYFIQNIDKIRDLPSINLLNIVKKVLKNHPDLFFSLLDNPYKFNVTNNQLSGLFLSLGLEYDIKEYMDGAGKSLIEMTQLLGKRTDDILMAFKIINYFQNRKVIIGKKEVILSLPQHINIFSGLIKTFKNNPGKNLDEVNSVYQESISNFIEAGNTRLPSNKENNIIFFIRASKKFGDETEYQNAITPNNQAMFDYFKSIGTVTSYIGEQYDTINEVPSPEKIIASIKDCINDKPNKNVLIHIGLHGHKEGSAERAGGTRTKDHFKQLFDLQNISGGKLHLDITSCNSGYKVDTLTDNNMKNISLDSSLQSSLGGDNGNEITMLKSLEKNINSEFQLGDFNENGEVNFHEMLLYRLINYYYSLTPTVFEKDGKAIEIADIDKKIDKLNSNIRHG